VKTVKDLCTEYGYSQTALSKRFGIPLRTVQDWHSERRTPPPYIVSMMEELLGLDSLKTDK
jgi:DNA-binding transcriptional regulator YiaG